jgi:hypothetical protein
VFLPESLYWLGWKLSADFLEARTYGHKWNHLEMGILADGDSVPCCTTPKGGVGWVGPLGPAPKLFISCLHHPHSSPYHKGAPRVRILLCRAF